MHDFQTWRRELASIEDATAYANIERNLIAEDGQSEPVEIAEITAAAFRLARLPALLGRALLDADEEPGAPALVVIGLAYGNRASAAIRESSDAPCNSAGGARRSLAISTWIPIRRAISQAFIPPAAPRDLDAVRMLVHVAGEPGALAPAEVRLPRPQPGS